MSISDVIVVMKDGVLQQMGEPQEIYDEPVNLFVAKFLGTPQINVFEGRLKDGKIFIGDSPVLDAKSLRGQDKEIYVAVRPEGFVVDKNGAFKCSFLNREVMGRDTSVVATHPSFMGENIRAIISAEEEITPDEAGMVSFSLKPFKVRIFDKVTEERISL